MVNLRGELTEQIHLSESFSIIVSGIVDKTEKNMVS